MTIDKRLLEILVCPATKVPVQVLAKDKLATLNQHVDKGEVSYIDGSVVTGPLDGALITQDGRRIYRINAGIPVLLQDQGITANQIAGW